MAADAPGAVFGVLAFGIILGFMFDSDDAKAPEPEVKREVKWIEKPDLDPEVITRVEEKVLHVVEPLPESCISLTVTARKFVTEANRLNLWGEELYEEIEEVDLAELENPGSMSALVQDLYDKKGKHSGQLYDVMSLAKVYENEVDTCEREIDEINGNDE